MNYCAKCGAPAQAGATHCSQCGELLPVQRGQTTAAAAPTPTPETPMTPPVPPTATNPPTQAKAADKNPATLWIVLNVLLSVLCCCEPTMLVLSVEGWIFGIVAYKAYQAGNLARAHTCKTVAKVFFFTALGMAVTAIVILGVYTFSVVPSMMRLLKTADWPQILEGLESFLQEILNAMQ